MKKHFFAQSLLACIVLFSSCATKLTVDVVRPAKLDMNGAKTISVLPFKPSDYYRVYEQGRGVVIVIADFFRLFDISRPEERRCVTYLHDEIERGLFSSPYVQVISANAVQSALKNGSDIPADVYLTGEVVYFDVDDEKQVVRKKVTDENDSDDGIVSVSSQKTRYVTEEYYVRHVRMEIRYQVVDSKTNRIIAYDRASIRESSSSYDKRGYLPSAFSMIEYDLGRLARNILRDLQPYTVRKTIRLMEDKSKMPAMKEADNLARSGYLAESYEQFLAIYRQTSLLAAGYNAAKVLEAMGRLSEAEALMKDVYVLYPQGDVLDGLYDIQSEIRQSDRLQSQISGS